MELSFPHRSKVDFYLIFCLLSPFFALDVCQYASRAKNEDFCSKSDKPLAIHKNAGEEKSSPFLLRKKHMHAVFLMRQPLLGKTKTESRRSNASSAFCLHQNTVHRQAVFIGRRDLTHNQGAQVLHTGLGHAVPCLVDKFIRHVLNGIGNLRYG